MDGLRKFASAVVRTVKPAVTRNMLVTNTATSAVLFTSGDVIQQRIEKSMGQKNRYDFTRSGKQNILVHLLLTSNTRKVPLPLSFVPDLLSSY